MSRAYRISASETINRHIEIKDGIQTTLELLPILPKAQLNELLAAELIVQGYECDGAVATKLVDKNILITVDLNQATVSITINEKRELQLTRTIQSYAEEEVLEQANQKLKERLSSILEDELSTQASQAREALTRKLKQYLGDIQKELDQLINTTTANALKIKARQLGEIEEIIEDGMGSMTIRIKM